MESADEKNMTFAHVTISSLATTYSHDALGQRKCSDHFIVSKKLCPEKLRKHEILDEGDNVSDHRPITIQLQVSLKTNSTVDEDTNLVASKLKWEKLTSDDIVHYQESLQQLVGAKPAVPSSQSLWTPLPLSLPAFTQASPPLMNVIPSSLQGTFPATQSFTAPFPASLTASHSHKASNRTPSSLEAPLPASSSFEAPFPASSSFEAPFPASSSFKAPFPSSFDAPFPASSSLGASIPASSSFVAPFPASSLFEARFPAPSSFEKD